MVIIRNAGINWKEGESMGLFFNKKKPEEPEKPAISFTIETPSSHGYDPWKKNNVPCIKKYARTVMLSCYSNGGRKSTSNDDFPRYMSYRYGITDPVSLQNELIDGGYLEKAPQEVALQRLPIAEIREIVKAFDLPSRRKKSDMIEAIQKNIDPDDITLDVYVPTAKGQRYIDKYSYVFGLDRYNISPKEYDDFAKENKQLTKPDDIIFRLLEQRYFDASVSGSYGSIRNALLILSYLFCDNGRYADGVIYLLGVLRYDLASMARSGILYGDEDFEIAPGIIELLIKYRDYYDVDMAAEAFRRYNIIDSVDTPASLNDLIYDIFAGLLSKE